MKLAIMQPYLFPYIGYYQLISAVDKFLLFDNVNYIKKKYVNRNQYLVVNGKPTFFIVPVKDKSSFTKISEIEVVTENKWRSNILKSLYVNYRYAPFFNDVYPILEDVINTDTNLLSVLNGQSIIKVCRYLDVSTEIVADVSKYYELEESLGGKYEDIVQKFPYITSNNLEKKVIRAIEICKKENSTVYVNAIGGQTLYNKDDFANHGISLYFIRSEDISYIQRSPVFYPNLSIIDVLMNCGKVKTKDFLSMFTLI